MSPVSSGASVGFHDKAIEVGCEACSGAVSGTLELSVGAIHGAEVGVPNDNLGGDARSDGLGDGEPGITISLNLTAFDTRHYMDLIRSRAATIRRVVRALKPALGLRDALDAGCGVGFFAQTLTELGLETRGFDGRFENVIEARKRFPKIAFERGDIESAEIAALGTFDLVLCFGLLYHLESPMRAIRHLRALTGKGLLIESMCVPGDEARTVLRDEPFQQDQSLTNMAFYPSEACLVKMLYRAGFAYVYRVVRLPEHDDFRETSDHARRRTILFASHRPVKVTCLEHVAEPRGGRDPWTKLSADRETLVARVRRFLAKPARQRYVALANRVRLVFRSMPIPLRLPFGAWWLAERGALDRELIRDGFEMAEAAFVERVLRPGMTVLDVGAHHGLYTLLASKLVGRDGRVIAFEPSSRERRRLERHLRINRCGNVEIQACALGDYIGEADFYLVEGMHDWCNSLRAPNIEERVSKVRVEVRRLDDVLEGIQWPRVDFIKLDVEGAELSFLHGARRMLCADVRPAILVEVQDVRTAPWGYAAREIVRCLADAGYGWFALADDGSLEPISSDLSSYDGNLVALPHERFEEFSEMGLELSSPPSESFQEARGTVRPCREHEFVGG
jgi:FkbM family methyltransferase